MQVLQTASPAALCMGRLQKVARSRTARNGGEQWQMRMLRGLSRRERDGLEMRCHATPLSDRKSSGVPIVGGTVAGAHASLPRRLS